MHKASRCLTNTSNNLRIKILCAFQALCLSLVLSPALCAVQMEETWAEIEHRGSEALDANEFWIAEPLLQQALAKAEKFGVRDIRLAKSLDELGRLYTIRARFADAEPYLEEALRIKELALGEGNGKLVPALGSLINFYLTYGTASRAAPVSEQLLSIVEGKLKEPRHPTKLKVKKGEPLEGWCGAAAPVAHDQLIEWAITCDAVGNAYKAAGNLDQADSFFKAALDLKTTVLGKQHLSLANSYDRLGGIWVAKEDYGYAEPLLKDAFDITKKTLPEESPEVYARLDMLGRCLIKEDKYDQAEKLYLQAQSFWQRQPCKYGEQSRDLYALGALYCKEKRYEAAAPVLQQALRTAEQFYGPESVMVVPYLQQYAYALYYLGNKPEVEQLRARANTISGSMTQ